MLGVPMMLAFVGPWKLGPVMPVGMAPATTCHCTGVGVAPLLKVVLQPVVPKYQAVETPTASVAGGCGTITQSPVGGAGSGGTATVDGVQPDSDTVAVGVRLSAMVTLQSGAVKPDA